MKNTEEIKELLKSYFNEKCDIEITQIGLIYTITVIIRYFNISIGIDYKYKDTLPINSNVNMMANEIKETLKNYFIMQLVRTN